LRHFPLILGAPVLVGRLPYFFASGALAGVAAGAGAAAGAGEAAGVAAAAGAAALASAGFDSAGFDFLVDFFFAVFFLGASLLLAFIDESAGAAFMSAFAGAVAAGGVGAGVVAVAGAVPCAETPIVHALAINAVKSFFIVEVLGEKLEKDAWISRRGLNAHSIAPVDMAHSRSCAQALEFHRRAGRSCQRLSPLNDKLAPDRCKVADEAVSEGA
jgi:hypothetical protein